MIKKVVLILILLLVILAVCFVVFNENIYNYIKTKPALYNNAKKISNIFSSNNSSSENNSPQQEIEGELNITVNLNNTIGSFSQFYDGMGMSTFNHGVLKPFNRAFFKQVAAANKKQKLIKYVNMKSIFMDEPKRRHTDNGAHVFQIDKLGNVTYNWVIVDAVLDNLLHDGFIPIISLTFMPKKLAANPKRMNPWHGGIVSPPKDYNAWRELIYQTIKHLKERYGSSEIEKWYFEVWNEPDLYKFFWIPHPDKKKFPKQSYYEEYYKLYDYTVDGALAAAKNIKIGGPGLAGNKRFIKKFIEHCFNGENNVTGKIGTQIDFVSRHHYGMIEERIIPQYLDFIEIIKKISGKSFKDLEIIITETGPSTHPKPWLNNRYVAAWIIKEVDAFLTISDKYGDHYLPDILCFWSKPVSSIFGNQFGLVTALGNKHNPSPGSIIKRPAFNGYEAVSQFGDERVELTGTNFGDPIHGIATKNNDSYIEIVLYHLAEGDVHNSQQNEYTINLEVNGCNKPEYTFEYYVINDSHSNGFSLWKKMGSPQNPSPEQLKKLQSQDDLELFEPASKVSMSSGTFRKKISIQNNSVVVLKLLQSNDQLPPHKPRNLTAKFNNKNGTVSLNWTIPRSASDGDKAASYLISRNGVLVAKQFADEYIDRDIEDDSEYIYSIQAVDNAGNVSEKAIDQTVLVPKDVTKPKVSKITTPNEETVVIYFNEPIDNITAKEFGNYSINNIQIASAFYDVNNQAVTLITTEHTPAKLHRMEIKNIKDCARIPNTILQKSYEYNFTISYIDRFQKNTLPDYVWTYLEGPLKECKRFYDRDKQQLKVLTGDNTKLKFSHRLPKTAKGNFSLSFLPLVKYPAGGAISILLKQDDNNFYKISNTDGYGPGKVEKVVTGNIVDSVSFAAEYSQNQSYLVNINFKPDAVTVQAFNERILLIKDIHSIVVKTLEVELTQQDSNFDDFVFSGE